MALEIKSRQIVYDTDLEIHIGYKGDPRSFITVKDLPSEDIYAAHQVADSIAQMIVEAPVKSLLLTNTFKEVLSYLNLFKGEWKDGEEMLVAKIKSIIEL